MLSNGLDNINILDNTAELIEKIDNPVDNQNVNDDDDDDGSESESNSQYSISADSNSSYEMIN